MVNESKWIFDTIVTFFLIQQFIMVFGTSVLNRPVVAAVVKEHHENVLNLLNLELARENVSAVNCIVVIIINVIESAFCLLLDNFGMYVENDSISGTR